MKTLKIATASILFSSVFLAAAGYADNFPNSNPILSCPSVQTLNSILHEKGPAGLESFVDQGIGWEYATTLFQLTTSYTFTNLKGVMIPTGPEKGGDLHRIFCIYNGVNLGGVKQPTFDFYFTGIDPGPFTGVAGDWNIVPAKSTCNFTAAGDCTFTRDIHG